MTQFEIYIYIYLLILHKNTYTPKCDVISHGCKTLTALRLMMTIRRDWAEFILDRPLLSAAKSQSKKVNKFELEVMYSIIQIKTSSYHVQGYP